MSHETSSGANLIHRTTATKHCESEPTINARVQPNISVGVRANYILFLRDSFYKDFPEVHRRNPEFRIGGSFFFSRR
jgi:hypothetical protein